MGERKETEEWGRKEERGKRKGRRNAKRIVEIQRSSFVFLAYTLEQIQYYTASCIQPHPDRGS
jgi:hypothetical protein